MTFIRYAYSQEKFEDAKWAIRSRKSQDRQCNGKTKKDKCWKIKKGQSEAANHRTDNAMAKRKRTNVGRYQRGNQKPQITGQTMPWQHEKGQMLEDIKGVIRSLKSQDRQCHGKTKNTKCWKIKKGQSEAANHRTDNAMAKQNRTNVGRYQRGNQKPEIAGQTMPWQNEIGQMLKDNKWAIRSGQSQVRQCNGKTKKEKCWKIPKGQSEAINRKTENTMAK
jgi:hypothetical protein